jgi:DNA-binding transcriptional MocR family regulator
MPLLASVALNSIANLERMALPMPTNRLIGARQLAGLLGEWRAGSVGPAYAVLSRTAILLILDGRLPLHCRLPSERDLATAIGVSRTTVTAAYDALRTQGYLVSRRGAGSWTAMPASHRQAVPAWAAPPIGGDPIDLAGAAPAAPADVITAAGRDALDDLPRYLGLDGYDPVGLMVLRARIAERYAQRGLPTTPDQILVTSGALHGLDLALRLLVGPGDRVLTDSPTYPTALDSIRATRARLVPVGLTPAGWNVDLITSSLRQAAPRLAYLIADYHNPTGALMPDEDRAAIAAAAARTETMIVVDESFVDLGYDDAPPPAPFATHDPAGLVLSIGSLSKPFWGGLRIGWVRAPLDLVRRLAVVRIAADMASPVFEQLVGARLLAQIEEVLPARRADFAARRDLLAGALREALPTWRFTPPRGGLALWIELGAPVSTALTVVAAQHGVRLAAGPRFGPDGTLERFLRLPFTQPPDVLTAAVGRLAHAYAQVDSQPAAVPPLVVA